MKNVSAVIPSYNGSSLLKKYIPDVIKCLNNNDEIIIVDDNSTDHSIKYLIKQYNLKLIKKTLITNISDKYFPQPKDIKYKIYNNTIKIGDNKINLYLVALEKNMRFAAAANIGILFANHEYILLLNNDVKPTKTVRNQLIKHFDDKLVFGVGCLEYEDNSKDNSSGKNNLWFEKGMFMHSKAIDMQSGPTAWVSGGSGMFDKNKWLYLNGFDQLFYPAYWEDVDLSFRAKENGWKVLFDENAVVFHVHESTNNDVFGSQKIINMSWNNSIKFVEKNANFWQLIQYILFKIYWNYKRNKEIINKA
jgi:GT2 family glycosyltransferase